MIKVLRQFLLLVYVLSFVAADRAAPEDYLWTQAQAGEVADFNVFCKTDQPDIAKPDGPNWRMPCRTIAASKLRALLTRPALADQTPHDDLFLSGSWPLICSAFNFAICPGFSEAGWHRAAYAESRDLNPEETPPMVGFEVEALRNGGVFASRPSCYR